MIRPSDLASGVLERFAESSYQIRSGDVLAPEYAEGAGLRRIAERYEADTLGKRVGHPAPRDDRDPEPVAHEVQGRLDRVDLGQRRDLDAASGELLLGGAALLLGCTLWCALRLWETVRRCCSGHCCHRAQPARAGEERLSHDASGGRVPKQKVLL